MILSQNNEINNIATGAITINGPSAYVWQGGETQQVDANSSNNHINNTIIGDVTVTGLGSNLAQGGGSIGDTYSASDANGNQITNLIDGHVTVEDDASFFIDGERNIVTEGVTTTSGNVVNNIVDQDVTLGDDASDSGYLELAITGAGSTSDGSVTIGGVLASFGADNQVTNTLHGQET